MSNFYVTYNAEAESSNTVKLIRQGQTFADVTDVYTLVWNSGTELYEATLDDATFVEDYYRIEDGAANIVVKDFPVKINITSADNVADGFVKNDTDDTIVGELTIKPASGTDCQLRIGEETSSSIKIIAENAAGSTPKAIIIEGSQVTLSSGATAIQLKGILNGTASGDAVNVSQLDAVKGVGWTSETLVDHETRLTNLEGSGTFSTPSVSLAATGRGGRGISLNWYMNNSTNEDAVKRYEVYMAPSALAGHAAGTLSSAQLTALRAHATRLNLGNIRDNSAWIPTMEDAYFIVVAFDHDSPETNVASAEVSGSAGNVLDETTPIVGDAASYAAALTALANELNKVQSGLGANGLIDLIAAQHEVAATATGTPSALLEYTTTSTSSVERVKFTFYKDDVFNTIRLRCNIKTSNASYKAYIKLVVSTEDITSSGKVNTTYDDEILELDCSDLANGLYEGSVYIATENASATCTMTNWILWRVAG